MIPFEVQSSLDTIVCLVDTREKPTDISRYRLKRIGFPHERKKLDFGDYSAKVTLPNGSEHSFENEIVIERKMHIDELAQCLTTGRDRFKREFERAVKAGARVYLLIENASWDAVIEGRYRTKVHPKALIASMVAWMARYDCKIVMVNSTMSGDLIKEILLREVKERLCRMAE